MHGVNKPAGLLALLMLVACGPPKREVPALTPENAAQLLHYNNKAETWINTSRGRTPVVSTGLTYPIRLRSLQP